MSLGPGIVAANEHIDVPNVIRLENYGSGRRPGVEPLPHLIRVGWRSKGIEDQCLAPRLNARRGNDGSQP
jgi:hypothetical protein